MVPETAPPLELFGEQEANGLNVRMTPARMPKAFFTWRKKPDWSVPIPILEQIGDGELEAGQEMFAFQESARADKLALGRRATDFNGFVFGIDDPGDLSAAGEKVFQALVYLGAGVVGGGNLDRQVRRTGKEAALGRVKTQAFQPGLGNER